MMWTQRTMRSRYWIPGGCEVHGGKNHSTPSGMWFVAGYSTPNFIRGYCCYSPSGIKWAARKGWPRRGPVNVVCFLLQSGSPAGGMEDNNASDRLKRY